MPQYASVAIPNVPKDTLTYSVPEGLSALQPGQRVVVPLRRRLTTGYVVRVHAERPEFEIKDIQEILDPRPVFSAEIIRLCEWIARYYLCSLGDAMKAALPQGIDVDSGRFVSMASEDAGLIERAVGTSKTKRSIVEALATGEVMSEEALKDIVGLKSVAVQLRDLMMEGVVRVESVLARPLARKKTQYAVRLLPPWNREEKIRELIDILERRAPKQVNILAVLWREYRRGASTIPMPELLRLSHASNQQVRALEEKEVVEVIEEEVIREVVLRYEEAPKTFELTADQRSALSVLTAAVDEGGFRPFLLHGVTASGKTQVYIESIRHARALGKNALVLVPEIALTPQLVYRFRAAFGSDVAVLHSRMSIGERYDTWRRTLDGFHPIVVGVRSAVFAPVTNVGLIIVDEEHDTSYKQSDLVPRYHARDVAVMRGFIEGATVLLGSATPSAESYHNAAIGKYGSISMPTRIEDATLPDIVAVDMTAARRQNTVHGAFSSDLLDAIRSRIERKETSIILYNRRGYAPHLECRDCGNVEQCVNCSISMVYHKDVNLLRCHYCGATRKPPGSCPRCGGTDLDLLGSGTQRVEEDLRAAIPAARIIRMDLDTTRRKGAHDLILTAFGEGEADVLLGTQMVAKGLDFPRVTLVGVIAAEQSLLQPDFRAGERTFQILTQVSGRSGRGKEKGEVIIQTTQPDHAILRTVYAHDYAAFIGAELAQRDALWYPPYSRLILVECSGKNEEQTRQASQAYHRLLNGRGAFFRAHPPQPALLKKINNRYRFHVLVRVDKRADPDGALMSGVLRDAAEQFLFDARYKSVRVDMDVDPQQMM